MNTSNYNRFIGFMAKLESAATTAKERDVINSARGMFAKCRLEATNAGTMTVDMPNGKSASFTGGMLQHGGRRSGSRSQAELDAETADRNARDAQWKKQLGNMKRRVKTAEHTLEEYAEIAPGELDAWVEDTLRPTIEEYLSSTDGGLMWTDDTKKKVKRMRGAGGFFSPEMKREQYKSDKQNWIAQKKKAKAEKEAAAKAIADEEAEAKETVENTVDAEAENKADAGKENPKKKGLLSRIKGAFFGKGNKNDNGLGESIATSDLRACFESVFGNSDHLTDDAIRAICYNAAERKFR